LVDELKVERQLVAELNGYSEERSVRFESDEIEQMMGCIMP